MSIINITGNHVKNYCFYSVLLNILDIADRTVYFTVPETFILGAELSVLWNV